MIALLVAGSAISLMACGNPPSQQGVDDEKLISRTVRNIELLSSKNGEKSQLMRAPLQEEHAFARPAFEEFRQGMEVIGFDSLGMPSSRVIADYALHWTERDLWELKGNVIVEGEEGQKLYTQQLNWDKKIKKIYSNVDCRVEEDGDVLYGVGFDAADDFSRWTFLSITGTVGVATEPTDGEGGGSGSTDGAGTVSSTTTREGGRGATEPATEPAATERTTPATARPATTERTTPAAARPTATERVNTTPTESVRPATRENLRPASAPQTGPAGDERPAAARVRPERIKLDDAETNATPATPDPSTDQ